MKLKRSVRSGNYKVPKKQIVFCRIKLRKIRRNLYDKRAIKSDGRFVFEAHPPLFTENRLYVEWDNHEITRAVDSQPPTWIVDLDSFGDSCKSDIGVNRSIRTKASHHTPPNRTTWPTAKPRKESPLRFRGDYIKRSNNLPIHEKRRWSL